jgi:hypothetical protein
MKAILIILVIGLGGYAAWLKQQVGTEAAAKAAVETDLLAAKRKAEGLEKDLKKATSELSDLKSAQAAAPAPVAPQVPAASVAISTAPSAVSPAAPATAPDPAAAAEAAEMARKAKRLAEIDARLAFLRSEQDRGTIARSNAEANRPQFSEQGDRLDGFGQVIGKKGVRTSNADREKALSEYNAKISSMDAALAEIAREMAALEPEAAALR